jgi:thiopurine S-methyltransferase
MDEELWRKRWAEGRIGFNQGTPNAFLRAYVERLLAGAQAGGKVLVPLAGKSTDLEFLTGHGCTVTGVELVRDAAAAFFEERGITPTEGTWQGFDTIAAGGVRFAIGDFFGLHLPESERFDAAYDRAALIAVRPEERARYVATLLAALRPGARLLLVTFAVEGMDAGGPPYSVTEGDVRGLFADCHLELLETSDITAEEKRFTDRGATRVSEQAWMVERA